MSRNLPYGDILYLNRKPFDDIDFDLPVEIAGVRFRNPFYVSSGPTTMLLSQLKRAAAHGWAGASVKLAFDPPPYINRRPRYGWDHHQHLLYFTAEKRLKFEEALRLVEQARREIKNFVLFSNFTYSGDDLEGWVRMAKKFEEAGVDINELNMCCPNMSFNVELARAGAAQTHKTGASQGQDPEVLEQIITAVRSETSIPLCVKLTPEGDKQHLISKICLDAGADMICTVGNRLALPAMRVDKPGKSDIYLQEEQGLYCMNSLWLKPMALRDVYMVRRMVGEKGRILGTGGVTTWEDAVEMMLAGADLVGICSATILYGFGFFPEFFRGFRNYLDEKGIGHPSEMRGKAVAGVTTAPELTLYEGYARLKDKYLSAPCDFACPYNVPAQAYVRLVAQERFREAFDQITSRDPLQAVCGYICNYPCENACTRGVKDDPIRIRAIKRFVMDMAEREGWERKVKQAEPNGLKAAIIGSGPSGITAAYQLALAGYEVTVFEREAEGGGMLRYGIPKFRLPRRLIDRELERLGKLGVKFEYGRELGRDFSLDDLRRDGFSSILLSVGTMAGIKLGIPGEEDGLNRYYPTLDFLREHLKGNELEIGKRVVVIGGGFTAVDAVRTCIRRGAEKVYMVYRRTKDEMTSVPEEVYEAEEEGVRVMYLVSPVAIEHNNGTITGMRLRNNVLGMAESEGDRRPPESVEGAEFTIDCDTIILAVSQELDREMAGLGLKMTRWGTIDYDKRTGATSTDDIFVAGDASMGPATVIRSIAEGHRAAATIDKKLRGGAATIDYLPELTRVEPEVVIDRQPDFHLQPRVRPNIVPSEERRGNYEIYERTMTREEAVKEAGRCLFCGCGVGCQICEELCLTRAWGHTERFVEIDAKACVACGICLYRCPNHNIDMVATELSPKNSSLAGEMKILDNPAEADIWDIHG